VKVFKEKKEGFKLQNEYNWRRISKNKSMNQLNEVSVLSEFSEWK
jgi:hypothetical protein